MPGDPHVVSEWRLTGRTAWRNSITGKIIVQVQEERRTGIAHGQVDWSDMNQTRWRDARLNDMTFSLTLGNDDNLKVGGLA